MNQNLILVTVDSLRADHCGFLGGADGLTPTLDELASDGLVFDHAVAPGPRTPSSVPVTFTGEFVQRPDLGVYEDYDEKRSSWMERRDRIRRHVERYGTFPERLQELGYDTAAVTANPWTTPDTGFDAGFDVFEAVTEREDVRPESLPVASRLASAAGVNVDEWMLTWPDFYDVALEARERLSEPYFLWVFLMDPHQPYITPGAYRRENTAPEMYYANLRYNRSFSYTDELPDHLDVRLRRAYRDTVRSVDAFVDRLVGDVEDDDPTIVIHADHGEAFGEHGAYGHRLQLYEENVDVPLLVHGTELSGRVEEPVATRKLGDALVDLARSGSGFDPTELRSDLVVSRTEENERVGVRDDRWSYVQADGDFEEYLYDYRARELYDRDRDPEEQECLAHENPEVADAFEAYLAGRAVDRRERQRVADATESVADRA